MSVDSNGNGTFSGLIDARQLNAMYSPKRDGNYVKYGQYDAGEYLGLKEIGIMAEYSDNAYIGFGFKDSDNKNTPTLCEWIEIDNNNQKHIFNSEVDFNDTVNFHGRAGQFSGTNHANAASLGMATASFNEVFPNNDVYWCYQEFGGIVVAQCTGTLSGGTTVGTIHWFPTPMLSVEDTRVADSGQNTVRGYINRDGLTLKNTASGNAFFALNFVYIKYS